MAYFTQGYSIKTNLPSLEQIKAEAKAYKQFNGCKHSKALNAVANRYGFSKYPIIKAVIEEQIASNTPSANLLQPIEENLNGYYFLKELLRNSLHGEKGKGVRILSGYSYLNDGSDVIMACSSRP